MTVTLGIVTGTYNRCFSLQRFVKSVRQNIPRGISYIITVVDGGSSDQTIEWCKAQPDIALIEQGQLFGAIKAFCDGAKATDCEYTFLGNDDIEVAPGSIVRALVHLEAHPTAGAVAFADDRDAPGYAPGFKVQTITAQTAGGQNVSVPYPQVGMVRRWLGEACQWWGADDPLMGKGHTYGGDNYLGARIWEHGFSVDSVRGVQISDHLNEAQDALREHNHRIEQANPAVYYKRYPTGPIIAPEPTLPNPQAERLRILYLPIIEPRNAAQHKGKRGLREALAKVGLVYEIDYLTERFNLPQTVDEFQPHLLLTQLHGADQVTPAMLAEARKRKPDMVCVNWNGDAHIHGLTSESVLALLKHVDLQLVVNAHVLPVYESWNIKAAYWQIGIEEPLGALPDVAAHDILFLGTCNSPQRVALETALMAEAATSRANVGLYGDGWRHTTGNTLYDFDAGEALYRKCKVAIGDQFWGQTYGFVSNRMFQALASGAFFLQEYSPGLDELTGLKDGVHYVAWKGLDDLQLKLRHWLGSKRAPKRAAIGAAGQAFVREHFNFDERVRVLFEELLPLIQEGEHAGA